MTSKQSFHLTFDETSSDRNKPMNAGNYPLTNQYNDNPNNQLNEFDNEPMLGGNIDNDNLNERLPIKQVSMITTKQMSQFDPKDFVWLVKTDGVFKRLTFENGNGNELIRDVVSPLTLNITIPVNLQRTVLDAELYEDRYHVFDCLYADGLNVMGESYETRMNHAKRIIDTLTSPSLVVKEYHTFNTWKDVLSIVPQHTVYGKSDGIIIQNRIDPYNTNRPISYKLKETYLVTIDFKLKYDKKTKTFTLYNSGNYRDRKYLMRQTSYGDKLSKDYVDIKFSSPFFSDISKLYLGKWSDKGLPKEFSSAVNELMKLIMKKPLDYDNAIVECSFRNGLWLPLRVRDDKTRPNNFSIAQDTFAIVMSPPHFDIDQTTYFTNNVSLEATFVDAFHKASQSVRYHMFKHSSQFLNKPSSSVLDIGGGRGGDLEQFLTLGLNNITVVEPDTDAIVGYQRRLSNSLDVTKQRKDKRKFFKIPDVIYLNCINKGLSRDNKDIITEIQSRQEHPKSGYDLIVFNFMVHYVYGDNTMMNALQDLIIKLSKPKTLILCSYYDEDKIRNRLTHLKNNGINQHRYLEIKNVTTKNGISTADMPLPTINASIHANETLVNSKGLNKRFNKLQHVKTFQPFCNLHVNDLHRNDHDAIMEHFGLVNVSLYKPIEK